MHKHLKYFLLFATLFLSIFIKAQDAGNDKSEILKVIKLYLSVTDNKDSTAIIKAFHPAAKLLSVNKNADLKLMTLDEWWSRVSQITNPRIRRSNITILDISGVSASVKVEFETSCDHISLLKFNNEWKIVNKTLSVVL